MALTAARVSYVGDFRRGCVQKTLGAALKYSHMNNARGRPQVVFAHEHRGEQKVMFRLAELNHTRPAET